MPLSPRLSPVKPTRPTWNIYRLPQPLARPGSRWDHKRRPVVHIIKSLEKLKGIGGVGVGGGERGRERGGEREREKEIERERGGGRE